MIQKRFVKYKYKRIFENFNFPIVIHTKSTELTLAGRISDVTVGKPSGANTKEYVSFKS